jgi:hypothetical protein
MFGKSCSLAGVCAWCIGRCAQEYRDQLWNEPLRNSRSLQSAGNEKQHEFAR